MAGATYALGIGGGTGAGKTTVAEALAEAVDVPTTLIPLDNYYRDRSHLPLAERAAVNYDHPDAYEWELLIEHLDALADGEAIELPQYDFETHTRRAETRTVEPTPAVIVEGIFALYDRRVRDRLDLLVYVQTDADVRVLRRIRRDVEERGRSLDAVAEQYLSTVKPMHDQFVAPTKRRADVIIPEGVNQPAISLLEGGVAGSIRDELPTDEASGADDDGGA